MHQADTDGQRIRHENWRLIGLQRYRDVKKTQFGTRERPARTDVLKFNIESSCIARPASDFILIFSHQRQEQACNPDQNCQQHDTGRGQIG